MALSMDIREKVMKAIAGCHGIGDLVTIDQLLNHGAISRVSGAAAAYHHGGAGVAHRRVMASWDTLVAHAVETGSGSALEGGGEMIPFGPARRAGGAK
jgi:hypothetical protein